MQAIFTCFCIFFAFTSLADLSQIGSVQQLVAEMIKSAGVLKLPD
jgi:hypothetical protein